MAEGIAPRGVVFARRVFATAGIYGIIALVPQYSQPDVDIGRLVVSPDFFRRGVGASLVATVVERFGAQRPIVVSTGAANEPAIRLYEKQGFAIAERRTLGDGLQLVSLRREPA